MATTHLKTLWSVKFAVVLFSIFINQSRAANFDYFGYCQREANFLIEARKNFKEIESIKANESILNQYFTEFKLIEREHRAIAISFLNFVNRNEKVTNVCNKDLKIGELAVNARTNIDPRVTVMSRVISDYLEMKVDYVEDWYLARQKVQWRFLNGEISYKRVAEELGPINRLFREKISSLYAEMRSAINDAESGKVPKFGKFEKLRALAKDDVVAQALNYASGVPEDASGPSFFYPVNNESGQCKYKIAIDRGSVTGEIAERFSQANKFISSLGIPELSQGTQAGAVLDDGIDLNKGDLKNMSFYERKGTQQNRFTGKVAYLRYQSRVEGLPDIFECDSGSCNIERLRRAWALIQTKCPGVTKAF